MKLATIAMSAMFVLGGFSLGTVAASATVPTPASVAAARTPADHEALAKAYYAEAKRIEAMAARHESLAKTYGAPGGKPWEAAQARHCRSVAADLYAAAKGVRKLAAAQLKAAKTGS